ncbi:MAG: hypothetical protein GY953_42540, partial [bacterium]|nr:hypothetical protein [bacterium]
MQKYRTAVLILWVAGSIAAFLYSQQKGFPLEVALPVAVAMLVELSLYAGLAFSEVRRRVASLGKRLAGWMVLTAVIPYLIHALAPGQFRWTALATLLVLAAVASFWYVILPHRRITDVAFLIMMAGAYMAKVFDGIYPEPVDGLHIEVLGQLMWVRLGSSAALLLRRMEGSGCGFWPTAAEWRIGLWHYLLFLPAGALL